MPLIVNQKYNYRLLIKINQYQFSYNNSDDKKLSSFKNINHNKSSIIPHDNSKDKIFSIKTADNFTLNINSISHIKNNIENSSKALEFENSIMDNKFVLDNDIENNTFKNINDNANNNLDSKNQDISLDSIYEEDYILQIKDLKSSYYPIYPNSVFGYTYYFDIHVYLLSKLTNKNGHIYPYYILNKTDNEIDSSKKVFRNLCLNYELNSFNELCFKKLKTLDKRKNKIRKNNRHKSKEKDDYILLKIPFKFDYYKKLITLHKDKGHCSFKLLVKEFYKIGYSYKGIYKDAKQIIRTCVVCNQKKSTFYKREPTKQLLFSHPNERIISDITELPLELTINTKYKYLLNLIDHFSKYAWSYLLTNKKSETIFKLIKDNFEKNGFPEQFGTDNGTEFANKKLKVFLDKNDVKFIHGRAFNPRSQGCVERLHRTIKNKLLCKKIDETNKFNLVSSLNNIIFTYNNTIHSTINFKPIEVYFSTSEILYKQVYYNTLNSFKHLNSDSTIFSLNEKVLLFNNFIIDKNKTSNKKKYLSYNKVKKNKSFYKIGASVTNNMENGLYEILIEKTYKLQ